MVGKIIIEETPQPLYLLLYLHFSRGEIKGIDGYTNVITTTGNEKTSQTGKDNGNHVVPFTTKSLRTCTQLNLRGSVLQKDNVFKGPCLLDRNGESSSGG